MNLFIYYLIILIYFNQYATSCHVQGIERTLSQLLFNWPMFVVTRGQDPILCREIFGEYTALQWNVLQTKCLS